MTCTTRVSAALLAGLLAWANGGNAQAARGADGTFWIVMAGGQRVAASGELEIRPPVARFRSLGGVLLSVRLDLLDLAATRAANRAASPLAARNVEIATPAIPIARAPTTAAQVGRVGEAAKRAGKVGTFTDLSARAIAAPVTPVAKQRPRADQSHH